MDSWNCQASLVQIGRDLGNLSIKNLITIGLTEMISGGPGEGFLGIPVGPNLNSVGHPWWLGLLHLFHSTDALVRRTREPALGCRVIVAERFGRVR